MHLIWVFLIFLGPLCWAGRGWTLGVDRALLESGRSAALAWGRTGGDGFSPSLELGPGPLRGGRR